MHLKLNLKIIRNPKPNLKMLIPKFNGDMFIWPELELVSNSLRTSSIENLLGCTLTSCRSRVGGRGERSYLDCSLPAKQLSFSTVQTNSCLGYRGQDQREGWRGQYGCLCTTSARAWPSPAGPTLKVSTIETGSCNPITKLSQLSPLPLISQVLTYWRFLKLMDIARETMEH